MDFDFQSSHVCDYLDIAAKFQFDEIVGAPARLDDQLLSAFISRHPSGLDVFAASRSRFHSRDLEIEALSALFDRMAHRYDYIVIDLPLSVHSWTIPLLAASKGILVTGIQYHSRLATNRGDASRPAGGAAGHCRQTGGSQPLRLQLVGQGGARGPRGANSWRRKTLVRERCPRRARVREPRNADDHGLSVRQGGQGHRGDSGLLRGVEISRAKKSLAPQRLRAAVKSDLSVDRKAAMGFLSSKNAGEGDRTVRDTVAAPSAATPETVGKALEFLRAEKLRGGTNLQTALDAGLSANLRGRSVFGCAGRSRGDARNYAERQAGRMVRRQMEAMAEAQRPRTYVFAVGDDANLPLARMLARNNGVFEWVRSTEPIDFKLNAFLSRRSGSGRWTMCSSPSRPRRTSI